MPKLKRRPGNIELLEFIAKVPQAFILKQGWAFVSSNGERGLVRNCGRSTNTFRRGF
jgi:hypothetical protein